MIYTGMYWRSRRTRILPASNFTKIHITSTSQKCDGEMCFNSAHEIQFHSHQASLDLERRSRFLKILRTVEWPKTSSCKQHIKIRHALDRFKFIELYSTGTNN